jgi:hypothetical protein
MALDPSNDAPEKASGDVVAQRRFAASAANVPGSESAQDAACNGAGSQQPGIAAMRHQPQKK